MIEPTGRQGGPQGDTAALLDEAMAVHERGDLDEAERLYSAILAREPGNFTATHLLGSVHNQRGDYQAAADMLRAALKLSPRSALAHLNLGIALWSLGQQEEAMTHYRYSLALKPRHPETLLKLACALQVLQQPEEALAYWDQYLALIPEDAPARLNRGETLLELQRHEEALVEFDKALAFQPDFTEALFQRGITTLALGNRELALAFLDRLLLLDPECMKAHLYRGKALRELHRPTEALVSFNQVIALEPDHEDALLERGKVLFGLQRPLEALASFDLAIALRPDCVDGLLRRGNALVMLNRHTEAMATFDLVLTLQPGHEEALVSRGTTLHRLGHHEEAIANYDECLSLKPDHVLAHSNKIFVLDYVPRFGFEELQRERRRFFEAQTRTPGNRVQSHGNERDPERRLVLGYVSADFRRHSAATCFGPVLRHHDRARFKVICYSGVIQEDEWTRSFEGGADGWRKTAGMSDGDLTEQIRADAVDILIDLSGHSEGNRLMVFARKPAPVQVTAWGNGGGTGLPTMDYLFTDPVLIPSWARPYFVERAWDLPCNIAFEAPDYAPAVAELPARRRGFVTYGSLNRYTKVTPATLESWAKILKEVPGSKLLIKDGLLDDPQLQERVRTSFSRHGISQERLDIRGLTSHRDHLAAYSEVDIALDTFPQNGGITTWEALWMGVPVMTMLGNKPSSRISGAILHALGLDGWMAEDEEQYVRQAVALASNLDSLDRFRQGIRARIGSSPAGDPKRYTEAVEKAYRSMWKRWLAESPQGIAGSPPS